MFFLFAIQEVCGSLNLDKSSSPIHPFSSLTSSFKIQIFLTLEPVSLASTLYDATARLYTTLHRDSHLNTHTAHPNRLALNYHIPTGRHPTNYLSKFGSMCWDALHNTHATRHSFVVFFLSKFLDQCLQVFELRLDSIVFWELWFALMDPYRRPNLSARN